MQVNVIVLDVDWTKKLVRTNTPLQYIVACCIAVQVSVAQMAVKNLKCCITV